MYNTSGENVDSILVVCVGGCRCTVCGVFLTVIIVISQVVYIRADFDVPFSMMDRITANSVAEGRTGPVRMVIYVENQNGEPICLLGDKGRQHLSRNDRARQAVWGEHRDKPIEAFH